MRVRYTPEAFADRERIIEYLRERSPSGARNVAASIRDAVAQLGGHPLSGYRTGDPEVRVLFIVTLPLQNLLSGTRDSRNLAHSPHVATGEPLNVPVRHE
jgi:plasmid stabilization system protein ParE